MTIMHQASSRWRRRCIHWKVLSSLVFAANPKILSAFQPSSVRSVHHLDDSSPTSSSFNNYYGRRQRTGRRNHPSCRYDSSTSPGSSSSSNSVTACHLFFRKSSEKSPATSSRGRLTPEIYQDLQASDVRLPFEIVLGDDNEGNMNAAYTETLSIRFMTVEDIAHIMPLCIDEFGTGFTLTLLDFPWSDWSEISNWWDRVLFEPMVQLSLRSKMHANLPTTTAAVVTGHGRVRDPAVMVLCRKRGSNEEEVVGMVELSLQAPEADKNPPPFPVPLFIKALYCRLTGLRLQGWVTNLLIDPRCRGLGYSKILMAVSEGIAKSWGCQYMFLHADADYRSGKVAQGLYKGLGYEVVMDDDGGPEYAWMMGGAQNPFSSIRMIDGVPLLCFKKEL